MNDHTQGYNYLGRKQSESKFAGVVMGTAIAIVVLVILGLCLFGLGGSFLIGYLAR